MHWLEGTGRRNMPSVAPWAEGIRGRRGIVGRQWNKALFVNLSMDKAEVKATRNWNRTSAIDRGLVLTMSGSTSPLVIWRAWSVRTIGTAPLEKWIKSKRKKMGLMRQISMLVDVNAANQAGGVSVSKYVYWWKRTSKHPRATNCSSSTWWMDLCVEQTCDLNLIIHVHEIDDRYQAQYEGGLWDK